MVGAHLLSPVHRERARRWRRQPWRRLHHRSHVRRENGTRSPRQPTRIHRRSVRRERARRRRRRWRHHLRHPLSPVPPESARRIPRRLARSLHRPRRRHHHSEPQESERRWPHRRRLVAGRACWMHLPWHLPKHHPPPWRWSLNGSLRLLPQTPSLELGLRVAPPAGAEREPRLRTLRPQARRRLRSPHVRAGARVRGIDTAWREERLQRSGRSDRLAAWATRDDMPLMAT